MRLKGMGNCTFSWMNPKLEVRDTGRTGRGVFAKENIRKNEVLSIHGGYIITRAEEDALSEKYSDQGTQISEEFVISSKDIDEDDGYFNHSCNPNAGYKGQIFLAAMRKIRGGEEVTLDYGMVLYQSKYAKRYKIECLCSSRNCRKIITDNDWKMPELQKRYDGYFQWYLQEKINKLKAKNDRKLRKK